MAPQPIAVPQRTVLSPRGKALHLLKQRSINQPRGEWLGTSGKPATSDGDLGQKWAGKQTKNCKAYSELGIQKRHANCLVKTHLQVKNFPRQSTQEATPDESEPARVPRPRQATLPPSGQMGSAGSDGYWPWGDQPGWPADGPVCRPCCPHRSPSWSPWSPGSNLLSIGTQILSPSPEAHGLHDKTVKSSLRVYRRYSQCPKHTWLQVSLHCLSRPHVPGH